MKIGKIVITVILVSTLISCCEDADTFRLTEADKQFIPFEIEDLVIYQNLETDETIEFTLTEDNSVLFDEDSSNYSGLPAFCAGSKDSYEERTIRLHSSNCSMLYSVSVLGNPVGIDFSIGGCDISAYGTTINNGEDLLYENGTYLVNEILYEPVYELNSSTTRVLITPGVGVLSFIDEASGDEYVYLE
jgi:hypothetical protein